MCFQRNQQYFLLGILLHLIYNSIKADTETGERGEEKMKFKLGKKPAVRQFDQEMYRPVLKCSICTGEQVAGFKEINSGKFEEVMLIRNEKELDTFMQLYNVKDIVKEY